MLRKSLFGTLKDGLNLIRVNDTGQIGIGHDGTIKVIILLFLSTISISTEDFVKGLEG